jgi:hypothetical protein
MPKETCALAAEAGTSSSVEMARALKSFVMTRIMRQVAATA